jgi:hypothetical protein
MIIWRGGVKLFGLHMPLRISNHKQNQYCNLSHHTQLHYCAVLPKKPYTPAEFEPGSSATLAQWLSRLINSIAMMQLHDVTEKVPRWCQNESPAHQIQ